MLYDNGALLELYALEHERTGDPEAERIVRETAAFLEREMLLSDGSFASAIDAETDGREGAFYVWAADELQEALGEEDFAFLAPILGFDRGPFFRDPHAPDAEPAYVLHLPESLEDQAARRRTTREELLEEIRPLTRTLFGARAERKRPLTDDKVLADWNGLAIRGLAVAGRVLRDDAMTGLARRAADRVLETMRPDGGPLLHAVREGEGRITAYLSDYAYLVRGLLGLHDTTGDERYLAAATELATEQDERLAHPDGGWYNAADAPDLLFRSQEIFDGATPAANAVAVLNALDLAEKAEATDGGDGTAWREQAERALAAFSPVIERAPEAVRMLSVATHRYHRRFGPTPGAGTGPAPETGPGESEAESVLDLHLHLDDSDDRGARPFELRLTIAPGWHLNANPASDESLQPTVVEAEDGAELIAVRYPDGEEWAPDFTDDRLSVYTGTVTITGTVRGEGHLILLAQPCDEARCLQPLRRRIEVK
jgi:uncharacterized protein YyaL (SSP411 family)